MILDNVKASVAFQRIFSVCRQQHKISFPLLVLLLNFSVSLLVERMQHIKQHDSTFALLKECKVRVLEIGSVGQAVY